MRNVSLQVQSALKRIGQSDDGKFLIAHLNSMILNTWAACNRAVTWEAVLKLQGQSNALGLLAQDLGGKSAPEEKDPQMVTLANQSHDGDADAA